MPNTGDKLQIKSSNGLSLRDGPDMRGGIIKKLDNESYVTVLKKPYEPQSPYVWAYVETGDGLVGWIVANDNKGNIYVKKLPKKKPVKRSYTKRRKYTRSDKS